MDGAGPGRSAEEEDTAQGVRHGEHGGEARGQGGVEGVREQHGGYGEELGRTGGLIERGREGGGGMGGMSEE